MFRKIIITLVAGCLIALATLALAGPETGVRGGNRDRVAVISANDFDLEKFEGKVVLIGFWTGYDCETCPAYIDWLRSMQSTYGEDGLVVVAVNLDRESAAAADLINKIHRRSQVILDPRRRLGARYEIEAIPSTYLHDRNLNLAEQFAEFVPERTRPLEEAIQKLIKQKYKD